MPKNIILLSDGTGNSNIKNRGTNVYKLYEAIDFNAKNYEQVAFYDDGVGTQEFKPLKILGGAFGWGLSRNIRHLYKELVQVYEPKDRIYLFGFSRGAFTVRRLASLIGEMGILDKTAYPDDELLDRAVWHCFKLYRSKNPALLEPLYEPLITKVFDNRLYKLTDKKLKYSGTKPNIEFLGVWDTVAAVGLPFDGATNFLDKYIFRFKFKNRNLHDYVNKACHALSVDDERQSFEPLLWKDDERIEQVWFPGVHSNVGGGYPQQGLSLVTLDWMIKKAQDVGIKFVANDLEFVRDRKYAFDKLYNSRSGLGVYYRYKPRNIAKICQDEENKIAIKVPKIHVSVFERISQGIVGYAPGNLPANFDVLDNGGIHSNSAEIANLVGNELAKMTSPSLLGVAGKLIRKRQALFYSFLVYSIMTLCWVVWGNHPDVGFLEGFKILVSPDGLLDKIGDLVMHHKMLMLLGVFIYGVSYIVRKKIESIFSNFWSRLRPNLRDLLKN
jgi:Uncharacterized alpha/beta hydrolase domain (DUF2235)